MTGAQFPRALAGEDDFDACVPIESTTEINDGNGSRRWRKVTKPVGKRQHRRPAGSDLRKGEVVVQKGETIKSGHILALASLGFSEVAVTRSIRVGVLSIGSELAPHDSTYSPNPNMILDANGPYLKATLDAAGINSRFLGLLKDDLCQISTVIRKNNSNFDVLITSGGVSAGKFDYVRTAVEDIGGNVRFHKLAIRPGHPVLFANIEDTAFFGLPGNPIAAAACLKFLVMPYLSYLRGLKSESHILACLVSSINQTNGTTGELNFMPDQDKLAQLDIFRLGTLSEKGSVWEVEIEKDRSSGKVKPLLNANCWVHLPRASHCIPNGQMVKCFWL